MNIGQLFYYSTMDKNVWTKAIKDTTGLNNYYETIKNNYKYKERAEAVIFSCKDNKFWFFTKINEKAVRKIMILSLFAIKLTQTPFSSYFPDLKS